MTTMALGFRASLSVERVTHNSGYRLYVWNTSARCMYYALTLNWPPRTRGLSGGWRLRGCVYDELKKSSDCGAMPGIGLANLEL